MPRRLTLVIHSLDGGGAERTMAMMASHWVGKGDEVTLITLDSAANDRYELDSRVTRVGLDLLGDSRGSLHAIINNWRRIRELRRAIRDANGQHVVSFTPEINVLTLLACRRLNTDVIIAERVDPRHHNIGRLWSMLRRWVYPCCNALVIQTEDVRSFFDSIVTAPIYVIPNCVQHRGQDGQSDQQSHQILAVGRLARQKGFDLLIDAFARVHQQHPDWTLVIVGDGPEREPLGRQIEQLGLQVSIDLPGWSDDLGRWYANSSLFVLSSRYEGFPNVLLEAMAAGLPVVTFDCDSGPREIVRQNTDGLLVQLGNVDWLANAMKHLISRPDERERLGHAARDVSERFSEDRFFQRWEDVFARSAVEELA